MRWVPALLGTAELEELAAAMPGPVTALERTTGRQLTQTVLSSIVHAIASDAAARLTMPAPPPDPRDPVSVAEAVLTRLDGSSFEVPARVGAEIAKRFERWSSGVTTPSDARLVVTLEPPDRDGAWFLSVSGPDQDGQLVPLEVALVESRPKRHLPDELARLERLMPVLKRPGEARRGQVVLSQDEAWELMTQTGPLRPPRGSTCGSRRCRGPGPAGSASTRSLRTPRWSALTSWPRCAGPRCSATSSSTRSSSRSSPPKRGRLCAPTVVGSSSTGSTSRKPPPPWPNAPSRPSSRVPRSSVTPSASRSHRSPGASASPAPAGRPTSWPAPRRCRANRSRRRTASRRAPLVPGRGRRMAGLPRRCRARRLSRPRHGPGQDADDAGAHRPYRRERPGVGRRATGRRGELGAEAARFTPGCPWSCTTGHSEPRRESSRRGRGRRRGHHDLRHRSA